MNIQSSPLMTSKLTYAADSTISSPPGDVGQGLFASSRISAGSAILQVEEPLVAIVDNEHLEETCSSCFAWVPPQRKNTDSYGGDSQLSKASLSIGGISSDSLAGDEKRVLRACVRCKVVRYCNEVRFPSSFTPSLYLPLFSHLLIFV
jgi:hypothetical protein